MKRGKGIVVEMAARNRVIVMTSQGEFVRVPFNKPVCVGQEIDFIKRRRPPSFWPWSIACVIFLAIVGSAGMVNEHVDIPGGFEPAYYVTLDINPSIELAINHQQRIVAAEGLNDDGRTLLHNVRVVGNSLRQGVEAVGSQARSQGYLPRENSEIVVTISGDAMSQIGLHNLAQLQVERREHSIQHQLEDVVRQAIESVSHTKVEIWQVPVDVRNELRQTGVTPANYIAIYVANVNHAPDERTESTTVTTTLERNGDVHIFEFQVTRPVLKPVTLTRTSP